MVKYVYFLLSSPRKEMYDDTPCDAIYANSDTYGNMGVC